MELVAPSKQSQPKQWVLNLCYYRPEKFLQYYNEEEGTRGNGDDIFDDDSADEEEEEESGGEDAYSLKKDLKEQREERNSMRRSYAPRGTGSGGESKPRRGRPPKALSIQEKGKRVKRKRQDVDNDDDDDDGDGDISAAAHANTHANARSSLESGTFDSDDETDGMSVLSGSTARSRARFDNVFRGKNIKKMATLTAEERQYIEEASKQTGRGANEYTPEQDAAILEVFLRKILRREETPLPYCFDEDYVGAFSNNVLSFEQYTMPANDPLLADLLNSDLTAIEAGKTTFLQSDVVRMALPAARAATRLTALLKAPNLKTPWGIAAFVLANGAKADRIHPELSSSLNSALDPLINASREAVLSGDIALSDLELYSRYDNMIDETSLGDRDSKEVNSKEALSADLPGAVNLLSEILRKTDWSETPALVPSTAIEDKNLCKPLPRIDFARFSDEALQHVFRIIVGNKWYILKLPPSKENGRVSLRGKSWREVLQRFQIIPTLHLFRQLSGYLAHVYRSQLETLRRQGDETIVQAVAVKRKRVSRTTTSSLLFPTAQLDASTNSATNAETYALAHALALSTLAGATKSSSSSAVSAAPIQIDIKEDIILATRPCGRAVLVKDEVLEKERELGLYDGPDWQHRAGKRGPKFARENAVMASSSSSSGSSSSSSSSSADASQLQGPAADANMKGVTGSNAGFFAREVNRVSAFVQREGPVNVGNDGGNDEKNDGDGDEDEDEDELEREKSAAWEAKCPWVIRNPRGGKIEVNGALLDNLSAKALAYLASFPGSTLHMLRTSLPFLTHSQAACIVSSLERRGLVKARAAKTSIKCDPFSWPPTHQGPGVGETSYFLTVA